MSVFRRVIRFGAALVVVAAGVAATGGSASAGPGPAWVGLSLINGWQPGSSSYYGTGSPAWAVQDGTVYLSGSIVQPSGSSDEFATLPAVARPANVLYLSVYTLADTQGWIVITPSGDMYAEGIPFSNAQGYTSLAAVSYPAASQAMQPLSLVNGWQSSQSQWNTGDPSFTVHNGVVYLSGSLHLPGGGSNPGHFTILPPGARPAHSLYLHVYTYAGTVGQLGINPDGRMWADFGQAQQFTSLAGVSFLAAATPVTKLPLVNGWQSGLTQYWYTGDPSFAVIGGVVYLSGSVVDQPATSPFFATLPEFARPANDLYIKITADQSITEADSGTLLIEPDGTMQAYSIPPGNAQVFTGLDGISYPLGS